MTGLGKRICIIGPSATGKSTLAKKLGEKLGLPVTYLDQLHHLPGQNWVARPHEEFLALHNAAIAEDAWIIEGNYTRSMPQRFKRADTIIKIEMGKWGNARRALIRHFTNRYGFAPRLGQPDNVTEGLIPWALLKWILFPPKQTPAAKEKAILLEAMLHNHRAKIMTLRSFEEINRLLD